MSIASQGKSAKRNVNAYQGVLITPVRVISICQARMGAGGGFAHKSRCILMIASVGISVLSKFEKVCHRSAHEDETVGGMVVGGEAGVAADWMVEGGVEDLRGDPAGASAGWAGDLGPAGGGVRAVPGIRS